MGYRIWLIHKRIDWLKRQWSEFTCTLVHGDHSYGLSTSCFWCGKLRPKE